MIKYYFIAVSFLFFFHEYLLYQQELLETSFVFSLLQKLEMFLLVLTRKGVLRRELGKPDLRIHRNMPHWTALRRTKVPSTVSDSSVFSPVCFRLELSISLAHRLKSPLQMSLPLSWQRGCSVLYAKLILRPITFSGSPVSSSFCLLLFLGVTSSRM